METLESTLPFALGQTVITNNAAERLEPYDVYAALRRHAHGDWGELDAEDVAENERSLKEGFRLLSAYTDRNAKLGAISITASIVPSAFRGTFTPAYSSLAAERSVIIFLAVSLVVSSMPFCMIPTCSMEIYSYGLFSAIRLTMPPSLPVSGSGPRKIIFDPLLQSPL